MKLWSKAGEGRAVLTGSPATEPEDLSTLKAREEPGVLSVGPGYL